MALFDLSSPWVIYYRETCEMFKNDPEVHVVYKQDENKLCIYVDGVDKAEAIAQLMYDKIEYGNVKITVEVIPANGELKLLNVGDLNYVNVFETAFKGNPAFSFVRKVQGILSNSITYVVFQNKVVQYFNDDLGDVYGQCSTLYQDIANRIFKDLDGVFYCTDVEAVKKLSNSLADYCCSGSNVSAGACWP